VIVVSQHPLPKRDVGGGGGDNQEFWGVKKKR
jgi:hypothetical protein